MSCKDCLHYEICEALYEMNGISKIFPSQCSFYKNNKMNNWISVKDRLPEDLPEYSGRKSIKVLVCAKGNNGQLTVKTMQRSTTYDWDHKWNWPGYSEVTHWMPLPEPPKGE